MSIFLMKIYVMKKILFIGILISGLAFACGNNDQAKNGLSASANSETPGNDSKEKKKVKVIEDENSLINKSIILSDVYEFAERIDAGGPVIDVRTPDEFNEGHISGAINIDYLSEEFKTKIKEIDMINPVSIYCRSGGRSAKAAIEMKGLGFKKIYDLDGGYDGWKEKGF